ncbi:unnamed protein product [Rhizophagus irregularis]|nr:unnamed protein product [Rhizophagus irregularis]
MSDFRRACVLHQPSFFKNDVFIHIKNVKKELNVDSTNPSLKPKIFHANLLYTHWNTHRTKKIYSRRLGISYEETIHARDRHSITHLNNKHIYRKKLCNLSIRRSHNPRVSKAQETRFDRAKRRIFNTKEHNPQRRALQRENERIAHFRLNQENAIMQGTSVHRVKPRQFLKDRLSTFCERVHDKMTKLTTQYLETDNEITKSKVYKTMSNYCTNIFEDDNIRSNKHMRYGNQSHLNMFGVPVDTSDDAKELELRPKKRRFSSHTTNLYPSIDNTDRFKRRRLSPAVIDDSTGVKIH